MAQTKKTFDLIAMASVPLVMVLGNSMLIPILPKMKSVMHLSQFQSSLVITAFSFAAGVIIPFAGFLSDRISRKAIIIPSLLLYGAGGILAGFAASLWDSYMILMVGRVIQGIGAAGTAPIAMALAGDMFKGGRQSQALGLIEASNGMGKVLSPIFGSLLALITWYTVFFAFPVITFLSAIGVWLLVKEPERKQKPPAIKTYGRKLKKIFGKNGKWLFSTFLAGSSVLFILFGVLFYLSDLLETKYKIDGIPKGGILAIPLLAMVTTSYFTGSRIKKKMGLMKWLIIIGLVLLSGSLLPLIWIKNLYVFTGLLIVGGIGTGLVLPCVNSMITGSVQKEERGIITSLYGSVRFFGVAFGPPIFGWLMTQSRTLMFGSISALALFGALICYWLIHPDKMKVPGQATNSQYHSHFSSKRARGKLKNP